MKKLLVTGASGFLGWNICQVAQRDWDVYGTVFSHRIEIVGVKIIEIDLTNFNELKRIFDAVCFDAVIHAAAIPNPNICQINPDKSEKINVDASINIAGLCADNSIPCVFTSTDLAFDGLNAPYKEEDAVCPVNTYGEQKVLAESGMRKRYPDVAICRISLMFGNSGPTSASFIQPMIKAMREGTELKLFEDEFRTPVSVKTVIRGLFLALEKVNPVRTLERGFLSNGVNRILHLGGTERISRYDFGRLLMNVIGVHHARILRCRQCDLPMSAPRPYDVSLDISKALAFGVQPLPLIEELKGVIEQE